MLVAHAVIWVFFIIMLLSVFLVNNHRGETFGFIWIGFIISCYGIGLSILAGIIKLLMLLVGL